jgi:hypothetical protein
MTGKKHVISLEYVGWVASLENPGNPPIILVGKMRDIGFTHPTELLSG